MLKVHILKIKYYFNRYFQRNKKHLLPKMTPLKLHLGCGNVYLKDYINIDMSKDSFADVISDFKNLDLLYPKNSVSEIMMIHSVSYLRLWEARDFFKLCLNILQNNGKLILEFPDILKCAKILIENDEKDRMQYIEGIRGIYAFDLEQIKNKSDFMPYAFGWSANHIKTELLDIGFNDVKINDGVGHDRPWRDTRIEATK